MRKNEFERIAKILAKEYKIEIKEGQSWSANIKSKQVFYRLDDIYNLSEDHILGLILHEVAHVFFTDAVELDKQNKELTHSVLNVLEDIAIENLIGAHYPNAKEILESTKEEVLNNLLKILKTLKISVHEKALLFAAARFEGRGYSTGLEDYEKIGEKISEIMIKEKNEILNRKQTKDLLPMANEIVDLIIRMPGSLPKKKKDKWHKIPIT